MVSLILSDADWALITELKSEIKRMTDMKIPEVLVSCTEAARLLGVTNNTVSSWIRRKKLTKRTIDGVTGILLADLMKMKRREAKEQRP